MLTKTTLATISSVVVAILGLTFLGVSQSASRDSKQQPHSDKVMKIPPVQCETIWQPPAIENKNGALMIADVPTGATFLGVEYWIRYPRRPNSTWSKCVEGGGTGDPCLRLYRPPLKPSKLMNGEPDQYYAVVKPIFVTDGGGIPTGFAELPILVRLVTRYRLPGPLCVSQVTVVANSPPDGDHRDQARHDAFIMTPPHRPPIRWQTFGRRRHPTYRPIDPDWQLCDDNQVQQDRCRVIRRIHFGLFPQQISDPDGSLGWHFLCHNQTDDSGTIVGDSQGACRIQLFYNP